MAQPPDKPQATQDSSPVLSAMNNDQRRVTINDIARQAGVSKTAVSFAFNMPSRLSSETTQRILDIARQLDDGD